MILYINSRSLHEIFCLNGNFIEGKLEKFWKKMKGNGHVLKYSLCTMVLFVGIETRPLYSYPTSSTITCRSRKEKAGKGTYLHWCWFTRYGCESNNITEVDSYFIVPFSFYWSIIFQLVCYESVWMFKKYSL